MERTAQTMPTIRERTALALLLTVVLLASGKPARAQMSFNSGSTGADGALDLSSVASGKTVNFKPTAATDDPNTPSIEAVLGRTLNWDDTRFDFTTVTIPSGVTVKMSARWTNGPVYWLATAAVSINGIVDLKGDPGHPSTTSMVLRVPAVPGPGGYPGGVGGNGQADFGRAAQAGAGPAGGAAGPNPTHNRHGLGGTFVGNKYLVPLQGGSGGGGAIETNFELLGPGGGAGGGAILIASSISIAIGSSGRVYAYGGSGGARHSYCGGGGSGGAIRLVAPLVTGSGSLDATAGGDGCNNPPPFQGGAGRVRVEAFQHNWSFGVGGTESRGSPLNSFVPSGPPPAVTVFAITSNVGNQSLPVFLPETPTGSFVVADATINTGAPVTFEIRARGVPVGTFVDLYVQSLEGADQIIRSPTSLAAFNDTTGRFTTSTTLQVTLPSGLSRGYVRAKW